MTPKTFVMEVGKVAENHSSRMQMKVERHLQNLAWGSALEVVCNDGDSRHEFEFRHVLRRPARTIFLQSPVLTER